MHIYSNFAQPHTAFRSKHLGPLGIEHIVAHINHNGIKQHSQKKCKEFFFIVSLFISVQIPSNFVCTYDIYIKNTKLYLHNRILYFSCDVWKLKCILQKKRGKETESDIAKEYCGPILALWEQNGAHWQKDSTQMLMAHCFQNNQVLSKTLL